MKQGKLINRIMMLVLLAAVVVYLAASAWRSFRDPYTFVMSYAYTVDDSLEATRLPGAGRRPSSPAAARWELLPEEGEKVARGGDGGPALPERGGPGAAARSWRA